MFILKVITLQLLFMTILAAESPQAHPQTLKVVFTTWKPYSYMEQDNAAGYEMDILAKVAEKIGIQLQYLNLPWKRCLYMLKNKNADLLISALDTPDRHNYMIYTREHISKSETALFTLKNRKIDFTGDLNDLKKYSIGTTAGFSYGELFDQNTELNKIESYSTELMVKRVLNSSTQLGIGNTLVVSNVLANNKKSPQIVFLAPLIHSQKLYACFAKKNGYEKLALRFSEALKEFKKTDDYKIIQKRYGIAE